MAKKSSEIVTQPAVCSHCGGSLRPGAKFCPACGKEVPVEKPSKPSKKFWKGLGIAGLIVGGVGLFVLIVSLVLSGLGLTGPGTSTVLAAIRSAGSGAFRTELEISVGQADFEGELSTELDLQAQSLASLGTVTAECGSLACAMEYAALNGESAMVSEGNDDALEAILERCAGEFSEAELMKLEYYLGEYLDDDLEAYLDVNEVGSCAVTAMKKLNNKSWLREHAGYSRSRSGGVTVHSYEMDLFAFVPAVLECFAPAFDEDYLEALCCAIEDAGEALDGCEIRLQIGTRRGKLDHLELSAEGDFMPEIKISTVFSEYGTCEVNTRQVKKVLDAQ